MAPVRLGASLVLLWGVVSGEKAESKKLRACPTETNIMTRDGGRIVIFSSVWLVCRCQLHHEFELNILLKVKRWGLHSQTNLVLMSMCFGWTARVLKFLLELLVLFPIWIWTLSQDTRFVSDPLQVHYSIFSLFAASFELFVHIIDSNFLARKKKKKKLKLKLKKLNHHHHHHHHAGGLILEYISRMNRASSSSTHVAITPCGDMDNDFPLWDEGRDEEFASLIDDHTAPCLPANNSKYWSCVKYYTREEVLARDKSLYGFQPGEVSDSYSHSSPWYASLTDWFFGWFWQTAPRRTYQVHDGSYTAQIAKVPKVTPGGAGYQKMRMTNTLKDLLLEW
jgi:hypothetical protein